MGRSARIGVSNFMPKHLSRLLAEAEVVSALNQIEVHPYFRALASATVQHLVRDGSATTFCVHGCGVIISRLINELGIERMVATRSMTATRPALADAARPAGCRMARTQRHDPSRQELAWQRSRRSIQRPGFRSSHAWCT